ncbi:MAG TPA: hypothetical protein PK156_07895 [Polyangium sp.]|nr:hypothetical protein [Polyangium sp.]
MRTSYFLKSLLGVYAALMIAAPVRAQEKSRKQIAEEKFQAAVGFAADGNFVAACPLLDQAQELDPMERSLFALADCREREGRIATALRHWRLFVLFFDTPYEVGSEKRQKRLEVAKERINTLGGQVPKVILSSKRNDLSEVRVFLDGEVVALGRPVEVDPGEHRLIIARNGAERETRTVEFERGNSLEHIDLDAAKQKTRRSGATQLETSAAKPSMVAHEKPVSPWNGERALGVAGIIIGSAGIVAGGIMGGIALAKKAETDADCHPGTEKTSCPPIGLVTMENGRALGNIATLPLVVGAAMAGTGIILVAHKPKTITAARLIWTNTGAPVISVQGRF